MRTAFTHLYMKGIKIQFRQPVQHSPSAGRAAIAHVLQHHAHVLWCRRVMGTRIVILNTATFVRLAYRIYATLDLWKAKHVGDSRRHSG